MHGDRVVVRLERVRDGGRAEGKVIRVLERSASTVVGRFVVDASGLGFVTPFDRKITIDIQVPAGETRGAKPGEMVTVEITRWPTRDAQPRRPHRRGARRHRRARRRSADHHPQVRHPRRAQRRGGRRGAAPRRRRCARRTSTGRTDFRAVPTVTIDGEHARDFDDAITIEKLPNGNYWLGVHIADVVALRARGQRARRRGLRARHVGLLSRARRAHVPVGAGDRAVQPEPARRSARAVVPDGGERARRRRALRAARRRDQQRRADDLHRRSTRS